jgi:hypothetical protein
MVQHVQRKQLFYTRAMNASLKHERFNNLTGMLFQSGLMSSGLSSESPFPFFVPS